MIGLVEAFDVERGERRPVDLSRVTETWLRDRLGDRADQALSLFSHVRPRISEAVFAYMLAGMAAELIYNE